ncbi:hypothetical protein fHeYen902_237 [Yersinia phage fHe-Yen9-02]|nr:hypothetical protein fHeYen902_237 [Yersinia phage fHe-Yen9-02]
MIDSELEKSALVLFARSSADVDYKRAVCYVMYKTLEKSKSARQTRSIINDVAIHYSLNREDLRSAISVLKSPYAFNALRLWLAPDKENQLCQLQPTPESSAWISELETAYPHLSLMIQ